MKTVHSFFITIILILFLTHSVLSSTNQTSVVLDVPYKHQNSLIWCWASTMAMVYQYKTGVETYDCHVVGWVTHKFCCTDLTQECQITLHPKYMSEYLTAKGLYSSYIDQSLTFQQVVDQIDSKNPVIVVFGNSSRTSGHAVVISGYQTEGEKVRVIDPMTGSSWETFTNFQNHVSGCTWMDTVILL